MSPYVPATTRRPLVAAGLIVLLAACGSPAASPSPSPIAPKPSLEPSPALPVSPGPSQATGPGLLLEVTSEGGFINPVATLAAPPEVVVDDDGRIYTPDTSSAATSTGIVAPITVRDVGREGAARILEAMRAAGLDREGSGGGIAADAGYTVFTAVIGGTEVVSHFVAGGGGGIGLPGGVGGPGASGAPSAAFDLLAQLTDPSVTWGAASAPAEPYVPGGYRVFAAPASPADAVGATQAWPLPSALGNLGAPAVPDFGVAGLRSFVVTGEDATALAPVLASATPDTVFTSGGRAYRLWVRPLFPDALG